MEIRLSVDGRCFQIPLTSIFATTTIHSVPWLHFAAAKAD